MTIMMYGEDWCPDCLRAKAFFDERGVPYTYVDLEAVPDQVSVVLERNNGVKRIPVVVFADDSHLVEPSNEQLAEALARTEFVVTDNPEASRFEMHRNGELVGFADYRAARNEGDPSTRAARNEGDPNDRAARNEGDPSTRAQGSTVVVPHVETIAAHRGQGYGARLMDGLLDIIRADGRTIRPLCPFAAGHIADNEAHHDLLAQ